MALPRGIRNNNPLNIVKGNSWKGEVKNQTDSRFEQFVSMEYGLRAGFIILRNYITGYDGRTKKFNTIEKIIRRWAPPIENNTEKYIQFVADKVGIHRYQIVTFTDKKLMCDIVAAMCQLENGVNVEPALIESAYNLV